MKRRGLVVSFMECLPHIHLIEKKKLFKDKNIVLTKMRKLWSSNHNQFACAYLSAASA